ncbi:hypothetical protein [Rhodohalobacter sp.]|uniref:hypothetical protein n=1 Tax=Rhodohalobacter sp. TaxID=1974210 RepID=UPI002ACE10AA|nr:hypothetical protein [Rhodohalobacter sp.]MDZ7757043.1 hypothetical protein [Rhodohalobacter sp.]
MNKSYFSTLFIAAALILTAVSCDSNDDHDDHNEVPVGFQLSVGGNMLVTQDTGTLTYASGDAIELSSGAEVGPVEVQFIAEDGDLFTPEGGEYGLQYELTQNGVIEVEHPLGNNQFQFNVTALEAGETTVTFDLMHDGHSDFETQAITIRVTQTEAE